MSFIEKVDSLYKVVFIQHGSVSVITGQALLIISWVDTYETYYDLIESGFYVTILAFGSYEDC